MALANVYPKGLHRPSRPRICCRSVRDTVVPDATRGTGLHVLVGGQTAIFFDFRRCSRASCRCSSASWSVLSFLLLMCVFRSLLIPLTAALMNLLSAAAAFGVVTGTVLSFEFGLLWPVFSPGGSASRIGSSVGPTTMQATSMVLFTVLHSSSCSVLVLVVVAMVLVMLVLVLAEK